MVKIYVCHRVGDLKLREKDVMKNDYPSKGRFRKKPVVISAEQLTEKVEVKTREGTLFGYPGDWLITGIQGEVYPCGDEIFRATYEPVVD